MKGLAALRSWASREVYVQFPHPPCSNRKCDPNDERRGQYDWRACMGKQLPNHPCERRESDRTHGGATGIKAHGQTTANRFRNACLLLLFSLMLIEQGRACGKDRGKSQ